MSDTLHLIPDPGGDPIRARLDAARRNLLDTTLRNRMLNYRPSKRYGVEASGEAPAELYHALVERARTMTFRGKPDPKGTVGDEDLFLFQSDELHDFGDAESLQALRLLAEEELDAYAPTRAVPSAGDFIIDTAIPASELQARLTATFRTMRQSIEEQGVNVLFLALGMLRWRERDDSEIERLAPLVLVPVELVQPRRGPFRLRCSGDEVGGNLPLAEKLKLDFGVRLPTFPELTVLDLDQYFADVEAAVAEQPGWRVDRGAAVLSFFSFAKYLMFVDLDGATWPDGEKPWQHPLIRALLGDGFPFAESSIPEGAHLDDLRPVERCHEVVDADSSQLAAIMEAAQGRSLVIQGPPGTGKSQTITNLVAEMVGEGKSVLFVAEKMAALEVVYANLRKVGLHDLCLELHSHKAKKAEFYGELARTLRLGRPELGDTIEGRQRLTEERVKLNGYCEAVNAPVAPHDVTPHEAMGRLCALPEPTQEALALPCEAMAEWDRDRFRLAADLVRKLQDKIRAQGQPAGNPFYGARVRHVPPEQKYAVKGAVEAAAAALGALRPAAEALGAALGLHEPAAPAETRLYANAGRYVLGSPALAGVRLDADWRGQEPGVRAAIEALRTVQNALAQFDAAFVPGAWDADPAAARADLAATRESVLRFFRADYHRARKTLRALLQEPRASNEGLIAAADAVLAVREARRALAARQDAMGTLFGEQWRGEGSDPAALAEILGWVLEVGRKLGTGELPPDVLDAWARRLPGADLAPAVDAATQALAGFETAARDLLGRLEADPGLAAKFEAPFAEIATRLGAWEEGIEHLPVLAGFNLLAEEGRELGMADTVEALETDPRAEAEATDAFARRWYGGILREAVAQRPSIERFDRVVHEGSVGAFQRLDDGLLSLNRQLLAERHWEAMALVGGPGHGEVAWLQKECAKKRAHRPIRAAMAHAGTAIRQIKPVFMMSPLSVALYLGPEGPKFDVVVFDEASQVKPEDAFGAIVRGGQVIVVGDSKQMPPTSFFDAVTQVVDDEEGEEDVTRDLESILTLMESKIPPRSAHVRDLRWHYRSRHESLIAPSNALFYDSRLNIFPSPVAKRADIGLKFHLLPDTVYGRGGSRKNPKEAVAVARAAYEHTRECPERTLGIVAFSQAQAEAIEDALDAFRRQDDTIRAFEERHPHERLFVKNLETVQGDERDVIFISVGYGKDLDGRLSMNFGPLNQDGGERRLNVLVTRARWACEVFCNFRAAELRVGADAGAGVRAFHTFLHYAETGELNLDAPTGKPTMSPLEDSVLAVLSRAGCDVEPQVGVAGFFIDIGVRDPKLPGRFALGVECDGASYHSSRTARDRDKLRQTILEQRGWRIHRVWSTDWWMRRPSEEARLLEAVERALALAPERPAPPAAVSVETIERTREVAAAEAVEGAPYRVASPVVALGRDELRDVRPEQMAPWIEEVVEVESPIHLDELVRRLKDASGTSRATAAVRAAVEAGVAHLARHGRVVLDDPFVWRAPRHAVAPRDRSGLDAPLRRIETVHTAEIESAVLLVVSRALRIARPEVPAPAMNLLGFDRVTEGLREAADLAVESLLAAGALVEESGQLRTSDSR